MARSVTAPSIQMQTPAASTPASCVATLDHVLRAPPSSLTLAAFVEHTVNPGAARVSVILVGVNVIKALAADSTGARWIAMMGPVRRVRCGGITSVSVGRQRWRGCALKGFSSARGSVVGCWIVGNIGVRGDAMVESAGNVRFEDGGLALVARRIIQGWSVTWRLPRVDRLVRRC